MAMSGEGDCANKSVDTRTQAERLDFARAGTILAQSKQDEERLTLTERMATTEKRSRTETRVVRLKRSGDRVVQGCDIYIGRACNMGGWHLPQSKWANPFTVRKEGSVAAAVSKYKEYIMGNSVLLNDLEELRGKTLGCWCHPGPCHGDILVALLRKDTLDIYFPSKSHRV